MSKWYVGNRWEKADKGKVQVGNVQGLEKMPETILRRAHREYELRFHGQDYERIQEREGFGVREVIMLLADALETADAALRVTEDVR